MKFKLIAAALLLSSTAWGIGYSRHLFGGWSDDNHDGCDKRCELLVSRSLVPVTYTTPKAHIVASGAWIDSYALGTLNRAAAQVDIDHVVALKLAWDWGASGWTADQRAAFYNDAENLNITSSHTNRSKGDAPPSKWLPTGETARCMYLWKFRQVSEKYKLQVPVAEKIVLGSCQTVVNEAKP